MKSHRIWPIWKPVPIKFFKSHRIFRPCYNTFFEEININNTLLCLSQASYISVNKGVWLFLGSSKVIFVKNLTGFDQIYLKILPYLTDFSPQLMACMSFTWLTKSDLSVGNIQGSNQRPVTAEWLLCSRINMFKNYPVIWQLVSV